MTLPPNYVEAIYQDTGLKEYQGNPFIEALPPVMDIEHIRCGLQGDVVFDPVDLIADRRRRVHQVAGLLDSFFQPLANHLQLEEKISIMIRRGYVGRNLASGDLNAHLQNGYERLKSGDIKAFRFANVRSTASSLLLIGISGCGKSTSLNRILGMYPPVIYHGQHNFIQLTYLKIECPFDASLKSLCLNFFREIDHHLHSNYEERYARKRYSTEVLLSLMSQVATQRAIGILVIDEIQRLSLRRSGGKEKMLEFFVQLVNTIGIPIVLVGTPKARMIFESELQSGRRGAGLGALLWEPMCGDLPADFAAGSMPRTEWRAFTNKLWKYQWLLKCDEKISEDVRNCWYTLSQGVQDIVVKLFVLAQFRAIATGLERITVGLLEKVYEDEFKPVHPMLAALRSGDAELIARYSDLHVPRIDKKLLDLSRKIEASQLQKQDGEESVIGNEQALRLYNLLISMGCESDLIVPLVAKVFQDYPDQNIRELIPIVLKWYDTEPAESASGPKQPSKLIVVKKNEWATLDFDDLRYKFSKGKDLYFQLNREGTIFDMQRWLKQVV